MTESLQHKPVRRPERAHHRAEDDEAASVRQRRAAFNELEANELLELTRASTATNETHVRREIIYRIDSHEDSRAHGKIATLWRRHISLTVPHTASRDHLALERTFLGYLRTSLALSMMSVFIAQLLRIIHVQNPHPFGFFASGVPLATVFVLAAMLIALFGLSRFYRQQNAMARGKVYARGFELLGTGVVVFVVTALLFLMVIAIYIYKDVNHE